MNRPQVAESLRRIFHEEQQRSGAKRAIVFWYDEKTDFENELDALDLSGVNVLRLDQIGTLELKIRLELKDTEGSYLLYAPFAEPKVEDDWLLDIKLYSRTFRADKTSIVVDELGLINPSLRDHLAK